MLRFSLCGFFGFLYSFETHCDGLPSYLLVSDGRSLRLLASLFYFSNNYYCASRFWLDIVMQSKEKQKGN